MKAAPQKGQFLSFAAGVFAGVLDSAADPGVSAMGHAREKRSRMKKSSPVRLRKDELTSAATNDGKCEASAGDGHGQGRECRRLVTLLCKLLEVAEFILADDLPRLRCPKGYRAICLNFQVTSGGPHEHEHEHEHKQPHYKSTR